MPDYKTLYHKLFNQITDVISELQQAQREAEELYVQSKDVEVIVLDSAKVMDAAAQKKEAKTKKQQ